ncbi:VOC family protein [Aliamphritea hakodatensis]|uniref:VOC family protein n=1 Tax=Aliamphritea hakodatensis TaxID=2895352 RepID=UPI0022FDADF8|nr:VOC family protein [Aliamphritea hakodatensis]
MTHSVFSHVTLGSNDLSKSAAFYDAVMPTLGLHRIPKPEGKPPAYARPVKEGDGFELPYIYIYSPYDGASASVGNGSHLALQAGSSDAVKRFYEAALENGGCDEGAPGIRGHYGDNYFAAYVRDPDGNKLQAVCYL